MTGPVPACAGCKHFDPLGWTCPAFPGGAIPEAIRSGSNDHRQPFPGDHGIRFEAKGDKPKGGG